MCFRILPLRTITTSTFLAYVYAEAAVRRKNIMLNRTVKYIYERTLFHNYLFLNTVPNVFFADQSNKSASKG